MGRFNVEPMRHMEADHFRILMAVELGMKNHEVVPLQLVSTLSKVYKGGTFHLLRQLGKMGLITYVKDKKSEGYRLTTLGYDYLALHTLRSRKVVASVGNQIGVGKESDVYVGGDPENADVVLKFHRLGRTSFRKLKEKRDYHGKRQHCSWLYLSRIAALKEFTFLKALHSRKFPVPKPLDVSRHTLVMSLVDGLRLVDVKEVEKPVELYEELMSIIVRLARYGLIHGDFNEFNLMLTEEGKVVLIDLPQMISTDHPNAEYYFKRDVDCVREFFRKRFAFESEEFPRLEDIQRKHVLDVELAASGFTKKMAADLLKAYDEGNFEVHKDQEDDEESDVSDEEDDDDSSEVSDNEAEREESVDENELQDANVENEQKQRDLNKSDAFNKWLDSTRDEMNRINLAGPSK